MAVILMKIFEESPRKFDRWMQLLTLGRLERIQSEILASVQPGEHFLEIGCGTGAFAAMLARRGARVAGIDISEKMIVTAQEKLREAGLQDQVEARRLHGLQVEDAFAEGSFDRVISVLALSEMTEDEIDCLLPQCWKVLTAKGRFILVDEVVPERFSTRFCYTVYRFIARLVTYLGLQAAEIKKANLPTKILYFLIELPLILLTFLVVPPATQPLRHLEERVKSSGFEITRSKSYLGGTLKLLFAEKTS
jgi:ubiquinone/menaquinone biosynthesis C-methylase UbiE